MKTNKIRLTESQLHTIVKNCIKNVLNEEKYMSDEDIASQYENFKVTEIKVEPLRHSDGWSGGIEIEFPNADDIDFDSVVYDNFIAYDAKGEKIAFDRWYPDEVYYQLTNIIRNEINKQRQ